MSKCKIQIDKELFLMLAMSDLYQLKGETEKRMLEMLESVLQQEEDFDKGVDDGDGYLWRVGMNKGWLEK